MENKTKRLSGRLLRMAGKTFLAVVLAPALSMTGVLSVLPVAGETLTPLTVYADDYSMVFTGSNAFTVSNTSSGSGSIFNFNAGDDFIASWNKYQIGNNNTDTLNINLNDHNVTIGTFNYNGNVVFDGEGSLTANSINSNRAFEVGGSLTFNSGSLTVNGDDYNGLFVKGTLTLNGGSITAIASGQNSSGNNIGKGIVVDGSMTVNGGTVTGISNAATVGTGIEVADSLTVTGGTVTGTSHANNTAKGIVANHDISISGGTVEGNAKAANGIAIVSELDNISLTGGTTSAKGGSIGIKATGNITISGDNTRVEARATSPGGSAIVAKNYPNAPSYVIIAPASAQAPAPAPAPAPDNRNTPAEVYPVYILYLSDLSGPAQTAPQPAPSNVAETKQNFDSVYYADNNPDLYAVYGYDHDLLWNHYVTCGKQEGRKARFIEGIHRDVADEGKGREDFDAIAYADYYADLFAVYGYDEDALWNHFDTVGRAEGRLFFSRSS